MDKEKKRVKLKGVLENTTTSVEIMDDGSMVIEFYDFSKEAESSFGNDVAYILTVNCSEKEKVLLRLAKKQEMTDNLDKDKILLRLMEEQFKDYFEIQEWLQANGIEYRKSFDPWA
jgi:hypothetical protein